MAKTRAGSDRRERRRAGSEKRDQKHRTGGDWSTINLPANVQVFIPEAKVYRLDIIPYEVGVGNPYADPGEWYYERTYFRHNGIGPSKTPYTCPAKTKSEPCPICEDMARMSRDPDSGEDDWKSLRPKERQLWLVFDRDNQEAGIQLMDISNYAFGKLLDERRKDAEEDDVHVSQFDDWEAGSTLRVKFVVEKSPQGNFTKALSIDFKARSKGLPAELLDHGICLDDILVVLPYDELKAAYYQEMGETDDDDDDDDEPKTKSKPGKKKPVIIDDDDDDEPEEEEEEEEEAEDEEEDEESESITAEEAGLEEGSQVKHKKFGVCEIIRISGDGTSLTLEDSEGEVHRAISPGEVSKVEKASKTKAKTTKPPKKKPEPEPEEDEEDSEEEESEDEWEEGSEEEEEKPQPKTKTKPKAKSTSKSKKAKAPKDDDDDEEEEDWEEGWE